MNRFDYPFARITTQLTSIRNNRNLKLDEVAELIGEDSNLQKIKTLTHFYPESEGKSIFSFGDSDTWLVLEQVTSDQIKITSVQKDNALYGLFTFIGICLFLSVFSSGFRRFAFGFLVFSLMGYGLILIANMVNSARVKSKLDQLEKSINYK